VIKKTECRKACGVEKAWKEAKTADFPETGITSRV
jgi:hypothetical protein